MIKKIVFALLISTATVAQSLPHFHTLTQCISALAQRVGISKKPVGVAQKVKIGVLSLTGGIDNLDQLIRKIVAYKKDATIAAIIISCDCSGSRAGTANALYTELLRCREIKPIVTLVTNNCLSGAYFTCCATSWIVALPCSTIGSIGVIFECETRTDLTLQDGGENEAHISSKVEKHIIRAGKYKAITHPYVPKTQEMLDYLQQDVDQCHTLFYTLAAQARKKLDLEKRELWADAQVFTGYSALELGLIDQLGYFTEAEEWLTKELTARGIDCSAGFDYIS